MIVNQERCEMLFLLSLLVLLSVIFLLLKKFSIKRPLFISLTVAFIISFFSSISLWFNYEASFGEQDGIGISNQISYWIITDGTQWSQALFRDYFLYSLIVSILIVSFLIVDLFTYKRRKPR